MHLDTILELPPEAPDQKKCDQTRDHLDPSRTDPYHQVLLGRIVTVFRLPPVYLEKLVEHSPDIVVAVDRHGTIIFYNDGAHQLLSYRSDEVLGAHVTRLYPDLDEARKVMTAMREGGGKVRNFETVFVSKNGTQFPVAISGSVIRSEGGEELGSIGFAKDLRDIRLHDQLATLGEVAISVAHEINNPLEVIVNNLNLLARYIQRISTDEDYLVEGERLDSIQAALRRIQEIVGALEARAEDTTYDTREYLPGTRMTDLRIEPTLPLRTRTSQDPDPGLTGIRILVVDDDLGICQSLRDLLTNEGCVVTVATGGHEALARLAEEPVDLVVSDVVMPDLDGHDLFLAVQERYPDTPVVLMTAFHYDKDHVIKRSKLAGLEDVLYKKPIDPPRLRDLIKRHVRRPAAGAAHSAKG
jgi:PAS domain S-box-containing protein